MTTKNRQQVHELTGFKCGLEFLRDQLGKEHSNQALSHNLAKALENYAIRLDQGYQDNDESSNISNGIRLLCIGLTDEPANQQKSLIPIIDDALAGLNRMLETLRLFPDKTFNP